MHVCAFVRVCVCLAHAAWPPSLFPPLTALEVVGTQVDGAVIIVQLRASMKVPGNLSVGVTDLEEAERERARRSAEARLADAQAAAEAPASAPVAEFVREASDEEVPVAVPSALPSAPPAPTASVPVR